MTKAFHDLTTGTPSAERVPGGRRGMVLILSSPSGAGKTTLTRMLLTRADLGLTLSVSATTRERRHSEADGVHYRFLSRREFEVLRDDGGFLEWAEVHGNLYGTPRAPLEEALAAGRDVVLDVDWQGAAQVRDALGDDVVSVFVLPPSMGELRRRLERRAEDDRATIERRLANAKSEVARWACYEYVLVNEDVQESYGTLLSVIATERLRSRRAREPTSRLVGRLLSDDDALTPATGMP